MPRRILPEIPFDQGLVCFAARLGQTLGRGSVGDDFQLYAVLLPTNLRAVERARLDLLVDALGIDANQPRGLLCGKRVGQFFPQQKKVVLEALAVDGGMRPLGGSSAVEQPGQFGQEIRLGIHPSFERPRVLHADAILIRSMSCVLVRDVIVIHQVFHLSRGDMQVAAELAPAHGLVFHNATKHMSRPDRDGSCLFLSENIGDHIGAALLGGLVQVRVDVGGGADVGVPEEVRDIDERDLFVQQDAGEGVTQIVEADAPQAQLVQQVAVVLRHEVRAQQVSKLVGADIVIPVPVVAAAEELPVDLLLGADRLQHLEHGIGDRQGAAAGFVFHLLDGAEHRLAVDLLLDDLGIQQHGAVVHVDPRPADAQRLAAAQAHAARKDDAGPDGIAAAELEERHQFVLRIVLAVEVAFLWALHPVEGIGVQQLVFEGLLEGAVQQRVVVDHASGFQSLFGQPLVEGLDILRRDALYCQPRPGAEVAFDPAVDHLVITLIGADLQPRLHLFQIRAEERMDRYVRVRLPAAGETLVVFLLVGCDYLAEGLVDLRLAGSLDETEGAPYRFRLSVFLRLDHGVEASVLFLHAGGERVFLCHCSLLLSARYRQHEQYRKSVGKSMR